MSNLGRKRLLRNQSPPMSYPKASFCGHCAVNSADMCKAEAGSFGSWFGRSWSDIPGLELTTTNFKTLRDIRHWAKANQISEE